MEFVDKEGRVLEIAEGYADRAAFIDIQSPGKTLSIGTPPTALRTSGKALIHGNNLWTEGEGANLVQLAEIAPGNRKYSHRHHHAETVWAILEGEGEFYPDLETFIPVKAGMLCHSYPWQWHGMGNTGTTPLRYLSVEGPMIMRDGWSEFAE